MPALEYWRTTTLPFLLWAASFVGEPMATRLPLELSDKPVPELSY